MKHLLISFLFISFSCNQAYKHSIFKKGKSDSKTEKLIEGKNISNNHSLFKCIGLFNNKVIIEFPNEYKDSIVKLSDGKTCTLKGIKESNKKSNSPEIKENVKSKVACLANILGIKDNSMCGLKIIPRYFGGYLPIQTQKKLTETIPKEEVISLDSEYVEVEVEVVLCKSQNVPKLEVDEIKLASIKDKTEDTRSEVVAK